ncbi:AAA family ATPase [Pseudonocardia endophytica]|uniref:Putative ATPase n=1 Tax=Pseudonocardia endophytica TaxID=401976 RepID=A0A4V2PHX9_PSEEN|nr:AAA family ATPase [Pseudonocardia endophytica]TCK22496.1 putative ATPase [Pseudonocardia endophytica]
MLGYVLVRRAYIPHRSRPERRDRWPYTVPCIADLVGRGLEFPAPVTFLVGENGSGKSTLVEAVAEAFKLDPHGGKAGNRYAHDGPPPSPLGEVLELDVTDRGRRMRSGPRSARKGFFLRAETAFGFFEAVRGVPGFWSGDTTAMSHGEGFLTVFDQMLGGPGLYLFDEPESALSFQSSLQLVALMHELGRTGAQVICATHSPILASTPGAAIVEVGDHGTRQARWEDLDLVAQWRRYLTDPDLYLRHMIG